MRFIKRGFYDGWNKRLTQEEEIISFLETEGFTELSEEDMRKYSPMSSRELPDDSELPDYTEKSLKNPARTDGSLCLMRQKT